MLSKVLNDVALEVKPVVWRSNAPAAGTVPPKAAIPDVVDETSQLRAKIAELTSAMESQSRQAYDAGLRAGETEARRSLEVGVNETVERMAVTIADLAATRGDTIRRAEADTVRLAIEIARRVLHRELSIDTSALEALIKAALEKLQSQEVYRVRVHPDQERIVRSCLDQMGRSLGVEVVSDPVQPRGGAVFEIARGLLDASVETQLREVERGLIDRLEARA
jgi:flagellar assembly protein FliH